MKRIPTIVVLLAVLAGGVFARGLKIPPPLVRENFRSCLYCIPKLWLRFRC